LDIVRQRRKDLIDMDLGEEAVALAAELVRLRSDAPDGERAAAERTAQLLREAGLEVELRPWGDGGARRNVIDRLAGAGERPICFSGHVDTVAADPQAWARDPWSGDVEDGVLHGRGACDMKGAVAAMIVAARAWAGRPADERPPLMVVLTGGEETGVQGARALAGELEPAELLIVGEPTSCTPLLGHRGALWVRLRLRGRPAHGATPHLGHNAIRDAAAAVVALDGIEHRRDPELGPSTLNVGRIEGGTATNVVADRCTVELDVRTLAGETGAEWHERLRDVVGADAELETTVELPAVLSDAADPAIARAVAAMGIATPRGGAPYITDASVLAAELDAPTLIWGPGDIAHAHGVDEFCPVGEIAGFAERLVRLAAAWPAPA